MKKLSQLTPGLVVFLTFVPMSVNRTAAGQGESHGPPAKSVLVEPVRLEKLNEHRLVTGELRARRRANTATQEPGLVIDIPVHEGDRVKAGQILAKLDSRRLDIALQEINADREVAAALLAERRASLEQTRRDLDLLRDSFERGGAQPKEVADAESDWKIAQARVTHAERQIDTITARADLLRERVQDTEIKAPFDGVVISVGAELGEWLAIGDPLLEIVSTDSIEAWFNVPQEYYDEVISRTQPVTVYLEALDRTVTLDDLRVIPLIDPKARTFVVISVIDDDELALAPGMSIKAWVPASELADHLTIPKNALLQNESGHFVYVARSSGPGGPTIAVPVRVRMMFPVGDRMVVDCPELHDGDQVVVEGNERLFPMAPIDPRPEGDRTALRGGKR